MAKKREPIDEPLAEDVDVDAEHAAATTTIAETALPIPVEAGGDKAIESVSDAATVALVTGAHRQK